MGMGGSDGCRNDILLIVWEYDILAVLLVRLGGPQSMTVSDNSEGDFGPPKLVPGVWKLL